VAGCKSPCRALWSRSEPVDNLRTTSSVPIASAGFSARAPFLRPAEEYNSAPFRDGPRGARWRSLLGPLKEPARMRVRTSGSFRRFVVEPTGGVRKLRDEGEQLAKHLFANRFLSIDKAGS